MTKKTSITIGAVIAIALGAAVALGVFRGDPAVSPSPSPSGQACTLEAKLCPDGSYVGRTGPNCAFAPCPSY